MSAELVTKTHAKPDRVLSVESLNPGFKVIAGGYDVDSATCGLREQREAREAMRLQKQARCECKVVKYRGLVYVLRSERGWISDNDTKNLALGAFAPGLECPLCGRKPFASEKGLRLHRCPKLPITVLNGRICGGRLDNDQIRIALEVARNA